MTPAEIAGLIARHNAYRRALLACEWSASKDGMDAEPCCPLCGERKPGPHLNCAIGDALALPGGSIVDDRKASGKTALTADEGGGFDADGIYHIWTPDHGPGGAERSAKAKR